MTQPFRDDSRLFLDFLREIKGSLCDYATALSETWFQTQRVTDAAYEIMGARETAFNHYHNSEGYWSERWILILSEQDCKNNIMRFRFGIEVKDTSGKIDVERLPAKLKMAGTGR